MGNNQITVIGDLASNFTISHEICNETFYNCMISVERGSGTKDLLPVIVSERLIDRRHNYKQPVCITGQIRSHNIGNSDGKHLLVYIFASEFTEIADAEYVNEFYVEGTLCKQPSVRDTPLGRHVADMMILCKRPYNKCDFIPCICWGRDALFASHLMAGDEVALTGRFQSREYLKTVDGIQVTRTAYEVSANWIDLIEDDAIAVDEPYATLQTGYAENGYARASYSPEK